MLREPARWITALSIALANGDGVFGPSDPAVLGRALAGTTALGSIQKCNAHGPADTADADSNGVPNDCTILDRVAMQRAVDSLPPGISQTCAPALL